jgi:hypothetical protein
VVEAVFGSKMQIFVSGGFIGGASGVRPHGSRHPQAKLDTAEIFTPALTR